MKTYIPIPQHLSLLSRLNQHDRLAGALGIMPNHLIQLLRDFDTKNVPKITHDLRFATFWATYHIWTKRQTLNREFWKIIPNACKPEKKVIIENKKIHKRKRRTPKKSAFDDCKNPFHFLPLKQGTAAMHGTCACSRHTNRPNKSFSNLDTNFHVTHFFSPSQDLGQELISRENKIPVTFPEDISGLDFKHNPPSGQIQPVITGFFSKTSADISREQQDRKKRFKK
jgi:hypothetical protein